MATKPIQDSIEPLILKRPLICLRKLAMREVLLERIRSLRVYMKIMGKNGKKSTDLSTPKVCRNFAE